MAALSRTDPTSFSNPDEVIVTHLDLDLAIDFNKHVLTGSVTLTLGKVKQEADSVILDVRDITIQSVSDKQTGQQLTYTLGDVVPAFGSKLHIKLPTTAEKTVCICIKYETSPTCSALQWLRPEQTAGKRQPYLFSQCQAIHCRSMIPCQDTPYVKATYTARITALKEIKVLMSALLEDTTVCESDPSQNVSTFRQNTSMPSYLIAIVGGDIVSRNIGPRSKVWSEEEQVDDAAYEFDETENMLKTAEDLCGPYVWGHYDLLVLPPSFPYGGMENPCLTFVTPTLLAGDRSLANVVAHEISHSWTGNLVTNKTFEDFWLNEGNTVFVERKIAGRLHGGEALRQFTALCGWNTLSNTVKDLGAENPYTRLVVDLKGVDPDDAFSSVPYEKGSAFLFYLEQLLGGPEVFEPFVKKYIDKFKYQSISTADWKHFLLSYFHEQATAGVFDSVDWNGWLYGLGMPPVKPTYDMTLAEGCEQLARRWLDSGDEQLAEFTKSDIASFLTVQTEQFLDTLRNHDPMSHPKIIKMGEVYEFSTVKDGTITCNVRNAEIRFRWIQLCIHAKFEPIIGDALQMVTEQGRMKFTRPLYKALNKWDASRERAVATFEANRSQMHNTTATLVAKDLGVK